MFASVVAEGYVVYMLVRGWRARTLRHDLLPMDSLIRLGLFSCYGVLTVVTAVVLLQYPNQATPRYPFIFMSTLPFAVWMIFWTQKDILRIWICRRGVVTHANVCDSDIQRLQSSSANLTLRSMRAELE